jgi:hypothetical protein
MDIYGNPLTQDFNQTLNTYDDVEFTQVHVSDAIIDSNQLATKLYVDTHGGGGGGSGDMNYVGTLPATNYIYKSASSDGKSATKSNIVDTGATVTVITTLQCLALDGQQMGGNLNIGNNQSTVTILADCIADKFIKSGGTNIQYLMANGSTLTASASAGNSNFYLYKNTIGQTTPPPISWEVIYNNSTQSLATFVYINYITRDDINVEVFFKQISQLNDLYIQDQNNSLNYIRYNITGIPVPSTTYITIPVVMTSFGGNGNDTFGNQANIMVAFFTNLSDVDTRLSTVESDTQNQSAIAGTTTFTGTVSVGALTKVSTLYSSPGGDMAIGVLGNNLSLYASNGVTMNKIIKTGGLATEFLKADGSIDTSTYALASSVSGIIQGMPVNSIFTNTISLPTGSRTYWFTAIAPYATLINGFNIYVDSGGADFCHFGIYRGYLKAGVGTNPGLNITLCGQSASGVVLSLGIPFNRIPIVAAVGQNLNFSAGEYLTIAFHTSGSSNVFLGTPVGALFVKLFYTTIANYSTSTFPATITNSSISAGFTQRPCFDLY